VIGREIEAHGPADEACSEDGNPHAAPRTADPPRREAPKRWEDEGGSRSSGRTTWHSGMSSPRARTLEIALVTASMLAAASACGRAAKQDAKPSQTQTSSASQVVAKPTSKASCDLATELGTCTEYKPAASFGLEKSLCEAAKGRFALGGCPEGARIGACTMSDGEVKLYYADPAPRGPRGAHDDTGHGMSVDEAKADCEGAASRGVFTASN
jgi:hypothetical protein